MYLEKKNYNSLENISPEIQNWWDESAVQYAFNVPSVGVKLDGLMGTNVVRMTDPSFMLELRERVWNDTNMTKKIEERKRIEMEREAQLILKGLYSHYNRPKKVVPLHSTVLALDLGDRTNFERKNNISEHDEKHISPIFKINNRTNEIIGDRRLKLTSIRKKNVDHVIRQTKLLGLEPNIEYDELIAIEAKIREIENRILGGRSKISKRLPIMTKKPKKLPFKTNNKENIQN